MAVIVAQKIVSLSEISKVLPEFTHDYVKDNLNDLLELLYSVGCDTNEPIEEQECRHRNAFGEVAYGLRWVSNERTDKEWIESGNASREAIDKASNNSIVNNLYHNRGMTEETQEIIALSETRDPSEIPKRTRKPRRTKEQILADLEKEKLEKDKLQQDNQD